MGRLTKDDFLRNIFTAFIQALVAIVATSTLGAIIHNDIALCISVTLIWLAVLTYGFFYLVGPPWASRVAVNLIPPDSNQQQPAKDEDENKLPITLEDSEVPSKQHLPNEEMERIDREMKAERAAARYWEYMYLNHFYVPRTQVMLVWFGSLECPVALPVFNSIWVCKALDGEQLRTTLDVLTSHFMIQFVGDKIEITPKGREYVAWRGQCGLNPKDVFSSPGE